ncbi:MAG TPA: DUF1549 domain-containing protein [Pirellulaceae bacterium]|jgi:mono/diheme cytochrome c family protein|nr:DUF1549 domain-containing protein [Pirellulaceae bacterium]
MTLASASRFVRRLLRPVTVPFGSLGKLIALVTATVCLTAGSVNSTFADEPAKDAADVQDSGLALFQSDVRNLLIHKCHQCHGGTSVKGDFDLTTREKLVDSGYLGETAEESYLLSLVRHESEPHMPWKQPKLTEEEMALLAKWIDLGAPYDAPLSNRVTNEAGELVVTEQSKAFWSFLPLVRPAPPQAGPPHVGSPIDRLLAQKREEHGVGVAPEADRRTLIRRIYLDVLGIPPTPEQALAFVDDANPDAWERLVDRVLASPRYGERWARRWIDVARWAESHGYEQDYDRPTAYWYRDFLIEALNDDLAWKDFVGWQVAGDELAPESRQAWTATGFLAGGAFPTQLTEMEFESARYDELDDMVATTGNAFLGLSIACARCHDHKFDPIPAREYYEFAAHFTRTIRAEKTWDLEPEANAQRKAEHAAKVENLKQRLAAAEAELASAADADKPAKQTALDALKKEREALEKARPQLVLATALVASEGLPHLSHHADGRGYPHFYPETHVLARGSVDQKQAVAQPGFLSVLKHERFEASAFEVSAPANAVSGYDRASLARWMTDVEGGAGRLVARTLANRLWQHHFGAGIVPTPNDFGAQGEPPTHPELLEWLACELVEGDGGFKSLHRKILLSDAYRLSANGSEADAEKDPKNVWLWRYPTRRLEAEAIRDSILAASGLLDGRMYGPGTLDERMRRRSIYFTIKRSALIPSMLAFDWPEHLVSIGDRPRTTVSPQALLLLNSPTVRESAANLAAMTLAAPADARLDELYLRLYSRKPTAEERASADGFVAEQAKRREAASPADAERAAWTDLCQILLASSEFLYLP